MRLLHKLRRRKRDKNAEASSAAASLLLPALPFSDDDKLAELGQDKATHTSNDSGYGSAENASPTLATTPAELSAPEEQEHSSQDLKFAQLVNLEQDVVNRRRRESIRFELFGTDDDDEEEEAREGESIQPAARPPPPRPRLNICTSVAGRRPPTAITSVSADSPQPQAYRPLPTWHSYGNASWSTTTCSYFQPRYHTWASQRLLDITHERIAASRRRSETFPPGPAAEGGGGQTLLAPPSSTHAPALLRELRAPAPRDPLRVRLARSAMLVKLRNGLTSDEAGQLYFGPTSRVPGSTKPPSYSVAASGSAPPNGPCPSSTTAPHPLALVLPRLPAWAHRPTYQERCVVTRPNQDGPQDEVLRPEEEERAQGARARPGSATVSSRVATFVAELAERDRLPRQFTPTVAIDTPTSLLPPHAPPPCSRVPAQGGHSPVSTVPKTLVTSPPALVEDLLANSRTVLIPARPSRPVRVRTYDDGSRPSSANNNHNDDDDDERPLAMLRRSTSTPCRLERRAVDGDLLGAQQVPLPFWLPPLISATASRTHSSTAWRPLSYAGSSAMSAPRRGVVVAVPREEVAPVRPLVHESDHPTDIGSSSPPGPPSVVVCTPAKARQHTSKPAPGSLYWPTTTMAPKLLSFPPLERSRTRQMPIATKRPDLRSRHSSIELHGSFKIIKDDFQLPPKSKRPWTRNLSLRKARSFWHTGPDSRPACTA